MRTEKAKRRLRGVSLVETAAAVSLIGVIAAAFVPTFARQLRFSKLNEATERLDSIYRGAAAYYATERGKAAHPFRGCLPSSAGPTPEEPSATPVSVDLSLDDPRGAATWAAFGQTGPAMLRYAYQVEVAQPGCAPREGLLRPAVTLRAIGDLDGDGEHSVLEREAVISHNQRSLLPVAPLRIERRIE